MSSVSRAARQSLVWLLVLIIALGGGIAFQALVKDEPWTPGLALDLAGGAQITLRAVPIDGEEITPEVLQQSVEIIRRRVDASGVAESEITTSGTDVIIVSLPGDPSQATIDLVSQTAQLQFRPVLFLDDGSTTTFPNLAEDNTFAADTPSSYDSITEQVKTDFLALDCTLAENHLGGDPGVPTEAFVTCDESTSRRFILGPVELSGTDLVNSTSGPKVDAQGNIQPNQYSVSLEFSGEGGTAFAATTLRLSNLASPRDQFAIVLDGLVVSAPFVEKAITGGRAEISGSFTTPESAATLANQLKFGALPTTLEYQNFTHIGATVGTRSLERGLLAGAIGLLLVVVYSMIQYRALGLVTVGSLAIAGVLTFGSIDLLSSVIGYRLSLAGVAGLIVSIGITADSFIVYFERVRDELRDGRSLPAAVEHGWARARRTIIASDSVSLLAAAALYMTAVGNVRGFAFTLGLTTLVDLLVVYRFTHPILVLLAQTKFFGQGHRLSGLDPRQLGRESLYKGRGRVATGATATAVAGADAGAAGGMTLAERKAAARRAAATGEGKKGKS